MSEATKGGLAPQFDLNESATNPVGPKQHSDIIPVAVDAANRVMHQFNIDPKTDLANERSWREQLTTTVESLASEDDLRIFVTDLDGFKLVNDRLGHKDGDELLDIVGKAFTAAFRRETDIAGHGTREHQDNDSIARLGGDEFAVFSVNRAGEQRINRTTDVEAEAVNQIAKVNSELRQLLGGTKFERFNIKLSGGSAQREPGEGAESVFARADLKMFEAKYSNKIKNLNDAIHQMTPEDIEQIRRVIAFIESHGGRVDSWIKDSLKSAKAA